MEFFFCVGNMRRVKQRVIIQVKWSKPLGGGGSSSLRMGLLVGIQARRGVVVLLEIVNGAKLQVHSIVVL